MANDTQRRQPGGPGTDPSNPGKSYKKSAPVPLADVYQDLKKTKMDPWGLLAPEPWRGERSGTAGWDWGPWGIWGRQPPRI